MALVHVSSTIDDLKPERQAVLDWLRAARAHRSLARVRDDARSFEY